MPQPVRLFPDNPPPLESYIEGIYKRELDHRINCLTLKPPEPKYKGMLPYFKIGKIGLSIGLELDNGTKRTIDMEIDANDLEATILAFEGRLASCSILSIRTIETEMQMEEHRQAQSQATTLDLESRLKD